MRLPVSALPLSLLLATLLPLGAPRAALAQDNSATVEALFNEGKRLAAADQLSEACPKFLSSYNLEHRVGTLLNLADCYEKTGQSASAWARFVEARTLAQRAGQAERADLAKQHADALLPKLSKLTITVPRPVAGLQVTRDGAGVDAGVFGVAVPVDPGDHVVQATAPGKQPWKSSTPVAGDAASVSVEVPALTDVVVAPTPPPGPAPASHAAPWADEPPGMSGRKIGALGLAGTGVVALGVGAVFGVMAIGQKNASAPDCNVGGVANACYPDGATARQNAVTDGTISSVLLGAGAALAIGGVVLWFWPSSSAAPASVSLDLRGLVVGGSF